MGRSIRSFDANNSGHTQAASGSSEVPNGARAVQQGLSVPSGAAWASHKQRFARGATIRKAELDPAKKTGRVAAMVRTFGGRRAEVLHTDRTGWIHRSACISIRPPELLFSGDAATHRRPSERTLGRL